MTRYYTVYAGINGAGKTTMYNSRKNTQDVYRINSDEILREFGGNWRNETDQYKAGKIAVYRIKEYFEKRVSFNQETTLATKYVLNEANKAKSLGYITELHYISVDSADIAIERIRNRVQHGGHGIPDDLVRRRYERSLTNLRSAINTFNVVHVYDNTRSFGQVATFYNGELICCIDDCPKWFDVALGWNRTDINPSGII